MMSPGIRVDLRVVTDQGEGATLFETFGLTVTEYPQVFPVLIDGSIPVSILHVAGQLDSPACLG